MIALYQGKSLLSKAIRWQTDSIHSHASWLLEDGREIESWKGEGVHVNDTLGKDHTPGTVIDIFTLPKLSDMQRMRAQAFLEDQLGKPYDWRGVLRFATRSRRHSDRRWFCSELVAAACESAGAPLFNMPPWKITPGLIAGSRIIEHWKTVTLEDQ
jgi:uncharacterized protein YycO